MAPYNAIILGKRTGRLGIIGSLSRLLLLTLFPTLSFQNSILPWTKNCHVNPLPPHAPTQTNLRFDRCPVSGARPMKLIRGRALVVGERFPLRSTVFGATACAQSSAHQTLRACMQTFLDLPNYSVWSPDRGVFGRCPCFHHRTTWLEMSLVCGSGKMSLNSNRLRCVCMYLSLGSVAFLYQKQEWHGYF